MVGDDEVLERRRLPAGGVPSAFGDAARRRHVGIAVGVLGENEPRKAPGSAVPGVDQGVEQANDAGRTVAPLEDTKPGRRSFEQDVTAFDCDSVDAVGTDPVCARSIGAGFGVGPVDGDDTPLYLRPVGVEPDVRSGVVRQQAVLDANDPVSITRFGLVGRAGVDPTHRPTANGRPPDQEATVYGNVSFECHCQPIDDRVRRIVWIPSFTRIVILLKLKLRYSR